ncbi:hypothetical protein GRX31_26385, partial [Delftia sp. CH05]|nr:hypothetical protein [Delftia sp. CH05]
AQRGPPRNAGHPLSADRMIVGAPTIMRSADRGWPALRDPVNGDRVSSTSVVMDLSPR